MQSFATGGTILFMTDADTPQVTEKDKKQDILDAYYKLLDQVKDNDDDEQTKKSSATKLKQTADSLKTVFKHQIDDLASSVYDNVEEVMSKVEEISNSLTRLFETREVEKQKWESEKDQERKSRQREQEDYDYNVKRKRQLEEDDWVDKKQKREADLARREQELKLAEMELKELREKDKTFEDRLVKGIEEAVSKNSNQLNAEFGHKEAIQQAQAEAQIKLLESKLENLVGIVAGQKAEIERLNKQIDSANQRLTEIASGAVRNFRADPIQQSQTKQPNQ